MTPEARLFDLVEIGQRVDGPSRDADAGHPAVIGLRPAQGSELGGIAYLATDQSTGQTMVSIFLSEGLG